MSDCQPNNWPVSESVHSILVVRTGHLGDTVTAIPALRMIRAWAPEAFLTMLCDRPLSGQTAACAVLEPMRIADRISDYATRPSLAAFLDLRTLVREIRPDVAIVLGQARATRAALLRWRIALQALGVRDVRIVNPVPAPGQMWPGEATRLCDGLRSVGIGGRMPAFDIPVSAAARDAVMRRLAEIGLAPNAPYLVFCGGGKAPTQHWPLDRYKSVLERLTSASGWPVVAIGSPDELASYREGLACDRLPVHTLSGLDLPQLFELLRNALVYFGNDTGPMHAAAAVGCPVVAVMSARNAPGQWYPETEQRLVFRRDVPCQDCFLQDCVAEGHRCMTEIGVDEVVAQTLQFLEGLGQSPARSWRSKDLDQA